MFKWLMVLLLLLFVYHVREVFPPFIVGAIIAYLLYPLVKFLNQRCHFPPFWSVLLIYFATGAIVGFIAWHFWPTLIDEAQNLFEQRREIVTNLVDQVRQQFSLQIDVHDTSDIILNQLQNSIGKPEEILHFGGVVSKSLLSILVCAVTSVYMLADNKRVGRFFMRFVAQDKRATVVSLAGQMDVMFRKYVLGQLGLITLMSFIAFCILSCCGIKYSLLIALVTGFLEIIPVLGPLLAIIIASVFAVAQLGISHFWIVPLWYWIARLLEDYVIVPNTIGHAVELHPLAVIFAVVVGETMAGALGMLIAIPVAASIKVVIDFCYPPTSPIVPSEHKSPLDKLIKSFVPSSKPLDPEVQKLQAEFETINAMHEASETMTPHASRAGRSAGDHAEQPTASGPINPIDATPGAKYMAQEADGDTAKEETAHKQTQSDTPAKSQLNTFKQIVDQAERTEPTHSLPVQQETLTGMANRIKIAETKAHQKQTNPQAKRSDSFTEMARQAAVKTDEKNTTEKAKNPEETPAKSGAAEPPEKRQESAPETAPQPKSESESIAKTAVSESKPKDTAQAANAKSTESPVKEKPSANAQPPAKPQATDNQAALSETTAEPPAKAAEPTKAKPEKSATKEKHAEAKDLGKKD